MPVATLIASKKLKKADLSEARDRLSARGLATCYSQWIEKGKAADIFFKGNIEEGRMALASMSKKFDIAILYEKHRSARLFISDMDSTMIAAECIDELAGYAGIKDEIAAVTERAMRGELDFEEALRSRVALLKGLDESVIAECLRDKITLMPGAKQLISTLKLMGSRCILVSGGFHHFADVIGKELGFDAVFANRIAVENGKLTGELLGDIVDAKRKAEILKTERKAAGIKKHKTLAIGDGANDIPMIKKSGLGVAYHAKPKVRKAADVAINHGDLTHLLYILGHGQSEWAIMGNDENNRAA